MIIEDIAKKYFYPGTRGYNIQKNYYVKYRDLFSRFLHLEFDDFLNQILLNVSTIKFSDDIKNIEAYIIGTIKIQCRVQIDKAIKEKNRANLQLSVPDEETEDEHSSNSNIPTSGPNQEIDVDTQELFRAINLFKLTLKSSENDVLNSLIESVSRKEIAERLKINLNTLDTQIRRLRIKFLTYLEDQGYSFEIFKRFKND